MEGLTEQERAACHDAFEKAAALLRPLSPKARFAVMGSMFSLALEGHDKATAHRLVDHMAETTHQMLNLN